MVHTTKEGAVLLSEEPSTGVYYQWRSPLKLLLSLEMDQVSWRMYPTTRIDLLDAAKLYIQILNDLGRLFELLDAVQL